ncbi:Ankyrin repeat-containing domain [Trypanosoma melophagium]|uniref:Ankyrin repeat-containing domain n=1 Tax=Trypanosoma melophagium TaxID=715481 RepID=UPI003519FBE6|nr:Ankyrin repeat-containing domain [Trypanosoma melophagium]
MPPKTKRRVIEDPNNTWNHQLMEACLRYNIQDAEAVFENGADPITAREKVPFYPEPLPPLIALLLLNGRCTTEAVNMMNWLLDHGAKPSEFFPLQGKNLLTDPDETGTVLHLLVQMGQPALLVEVLALIGEPRPRPISLLKRLPRLDPTVASMFSLQPSSSVAHGSVAAASTTSPRRIGSASANAVSSGGGGSAPRRSGRHSHASPDSSGPLSPIFHLDANVHLKGDVIDFSARTSVHNWTAMDLALRRGDAMMIQLLLYYGAHGIFHCLVNGIQTALARACAAGDKELVETLLDAGDSIGQISLDGRYTLIHYAAAQPAVLDLLLARGLSIDAPNAFGESALVSLICYGQGANAEYAIRETARPADAARLAALPPPALRNYILTPLPPIMASSSTTPGTAARASKAIGNIPGSGMGDMECPTIVRDADAWWYFASGSNTWAMIQNLYERGADVNGEMVAKESRKLLRRSSENKQTLLLKAPPQYQQPFHHSLSVSPSISSLSDSSGASTGTPRGVSPVDDNNEENEMRPKMQYTVHLTPLMHAIIAYHPELIRRLSVEYRADPMVQNAFGACALHYAAIARHPSVMELMLSQLVAPVHPNFDINIQDCCGRTPLHYAAMYGNVPVVRVLLALGQSLHASKPDYAGRTPLHLAVLAGESSVVGLLLHHAESASLVMESMSTASVPPSKKRPISLRRKLRHSSVGISDGTSIDPTTVSAGVIDVESEDLLSGQTALEMAVYITRDVGIVRLLLTVGCACVRHSSGLPTGGTLLHRTVVDGLTDIMLLLLENYVEPNEMDDREQTPLHLAAQSSLPQGCEMVRELLRFGAAPESQSGCTLETPIIIAARRGNAEMLDFMLHQQEEFAALSTVDSYSSRAAERARARSDTRNRSTSSPSTRRAAKQQQSQSQKATRVRSQNLRGSNISMASEVNGNYAYDNTGSGDSRIMLLSPGTTTTTTGQQQQQQAAVPAASPRGSNDNSLDRPLLCPSHLLIPDGKVRTALHYLCDQSDAKKQKELLPLLCEILRCPLASTLILQLDCNGRLPLHDACASGYTAAVQELLRHDDGGTPLFMDANGSTPLHYAVMADDAESIVALVRSTEFWLPCALKGVSSAVDAPNLIPITSRIMEQRKNGLDSHGSEGRRETWVEDKWSYLNVHDNVGRTPLLLAAELGRRKASAVLISLLRECSKMSRKTSPGIARTPFVNADGNTPVATL